MKTEKNQAQSICLSTKGNTVNSISTKEIIDDLNNNRPELVELAKKIFEHEGLDVEIRPDTDLRAVDNHDTWINLVVDGKARCQFRPDPDQVIDDSARIPVIPNPIEVRYVASVTLDADRAYEIYIDEDENIYYIDSLKYCAPDEAIKAARQGDITRFHINPAEGYILLDMTQSPPLACSHTLKGATEMIRHMKLVTYTKLKRIDPSPTLKNVIMNGVVAYPNWNFHKNLPPSGWLSYHDILELAKHHLTPETTNIDVILAQEVLRG